MPLETPRTLDREKKRRTLLLQIVLSSATSAKRAQLCRIHTNLSCCTHAAEFADFERFWRWILTDLAITQTSAVIERLIRFIYRSGLWWPRGYNSCIRAHFNIFSSPLQTVHLSGGLPICRLGVNYTHTQFGCDGGFGRHIKTTNAHHNP